MSKEDVDVANDIVLILYFRVYDEEDTELLQYWDKTYKFIHNAK